MQIEMEKLMEQSGLPKAQKEKPARTAKPLSAPRNETIKPLAAPVEQLSLWELAG